MNTFGKIAGGVGLLLVLTSIITFTQSTTGGIIKVVLGAALLGLWFTTNRNEASNLGNSLFFYGSSALVAAIVLASLVAANFIVNKRGRTWDLTSKKLYSLSPQTVNVLKELKDPVKIICFSEKPIPTVEDLMRRYQNETDKLSFDFKDPNRANDLTKKYDVRQGQLAAVIIKNPGPSETHQLVNLGALAAPTDGEQTLTNALVKLNQVGQQKLYFVEGHGEIPLEGPTQDPMMGQQQNVRSLALVKKNLEDDGYAPSSFNLTERGEVPVDASAVAVVGSATPFTEREVKLLESYLDKGGRLLVFTDQGLETGLEGLLSKYGVQVEPGIVADERQNAGQPYALVSGSYGDSEIVRPLKLAKTGVLFLVSRGLTLLKEGILAGVTASPLVLSSQFAWIETQLTDDPSLDSGERSGQIALAAFSTRDTKSAEGKRADEARVVVFGDTDLLTNGYRLPQNRDMVLNAFAWTTAQLQKITIRPPDRETSTLEIDQDKFSNIRLIVMDLMPTILLAVGLTIARTRRAR